MSGHQPEDDRVSAETNRIAAEGGRITAEGERVTAGEARITAESERAHRRRRITLTQLLAYLVVAAVGAFGFWQIGQTQAQLCVIAETNQNAIQNVVIAVEALGSSLVLDGKPASKATPEEQKSLDTLTAFREQQLALLSEETC